MLWKFGSPACLILTEIVESRRAIRYKIKHWFEIILYTVWVTRMLLALATRWFRTSSWFQYWLYDPFSYFHYRNNEKLFYHFLILFATFFIAGLYGTYMMFFGACNSFDVPYELIINVLMVERACFKCQGERNEILRRTYLKMITKLSNKWWYPVVPRFLWECCCWRLAKLRIVLALDHVNRKNLERYGQDDHLKDVSFEFRRKLVEFMWIQDSLYYFVNMIVLLIYWSVTFYYYVKVVEHFHIVYLYQHLLLILDIISLTMNCVQTFQLIYSGFVLNYALQLYNNLLNTKIYDTFKAFTLQTKHPYNGLVRFKSWKLRSVLKKSHDQHMHLCCLFRKLFEEGWSRMVLMVFIIGIPSNVIALWSSIKHTLSWSHLFILYVMNSSQLITLIGVLITGAEHTRQLYRPRKFLFQITGMIQSNRQMPETLRCKLKYDDWFHRMINGPKYGPFISLWGALTYLSVLDVSFSPEVTDLPTT